MNVITPEPDPRDALHFPPAALPIQATESREIPDARPHGDCLDLGDVAKNDEVFHVGILDRTLGIRGRWTPQFSELVSTLAAGPKRCCPNDRRTFAMRVPPSRGTRQLAGETFRCTFRFGPGTFPGRGGWFGDSA